MLSIHQLIRAHELISVYLFDYSAVCFSSLTTLVQCSSDSNICTNNLQHKSWQSDFIIPFPSFLTSSCTMQNFSIVQSELCVFGHCRGKGSFIEIACLYVKTLLMNANERTLIIIFSSFIYNFVALSAISLLILFTAI